MIKKRSSCVNKLKVQQKTSIPIPRILDWSADAGNNIGSEYIISEHAEGTNLHFKWPDMTDAQRMKCINNIYRCLKDLDDITFPAYGSIYFADTELASKTYSLHGKNKDKDFIISPHCGTRYWDCDSTKFYSHHGKADQRPCTSPTYHHPTHTQTKQKPTKQSNSGQNMAEYSTAQIQTSLAKLPPHLPRHNPPTHIPPLPHPTSPAQDVHRSTHKRLLQSPPLPPRPTQAEYLHLRR